MAHAVDLGSIATALTARVGVAIPTPDPDSLRQAYHRALKRLAGRVPPVAFVIPSHLPNTLWIIRLEFMKGKHPDYAKIRTALEEVPCETLRGSSGEAGG